MMVSILASARIPSGTRSSRLRCNAVGVQHTEVFLEHPHPVIAGREHSTIEHRRTVLKHVSICIDA
jgi:hypothetical protein